MNVIEAFDFLSRENDADLFLLDINMSTMDGLQFMEKINHKNFYQYIPIIAVGTEGKEEGPLSALNLGAHCYVTKLFTAHTLHEIIKSIFPDKQSSFPNMINV